jgi:hypothetical protein
MALQRCYSNFERYLAAGAPSSAITELGSIVLALPRLPADERRRWEDVLRNAPVPDAVLARSSSDIENDVARVVRLSESDRDLQFDEYCLLLSLRYDVSCALAILARLGQSTERGPLERTDAALLEMAKEDKKRQTLGRASLFVSKNRGPLVRPEDLLPTAWTH